MIGVLGSLHAYMQRRGALVGAPLPGQGCSSAAVAHDWGDRADGGVLLDVNHPVVVTKVSLRGAG
jgi:hypothetical protein